MRPATAALEEFLGSHQMVNSTYAHDIHVLGLRASICSSLQMELLDRAIQRGLAQVSEVHESGVVSECLVINTGDRPILVLEGEEIRGSKQNRVFNVSMLLDSESRTRVPVSCVERGRWTYRSSHFSSGGITTSSLRKKLSETVTGSLEETRTFHSDQTQIWDTVDECLDASETLSGTRSISDAFDRHQKALESFVGLLEERMAGCTGYIIYCDDRILACDLFLCEDLFAAFRGRLMTAAAFDTMAKRRRRADSRKAGTTSPEDQILNRLRNLPLEEMKVYPSVSLGQNLRLRADRLSASALLVDDEVAHFSMHGS